LINGSKPGPRLYLGAAIHGDEVNGVAILSTALGKLDPKRVSGQIVCIPVQHPLSFYADHRLPLAQFLKSPLDQAPADTWTCFPGDLQGNLAQRLAARLFGIITQCDYAVDVHTPTRGGRYVPIAILPPPGLKDYGRVQDLARALNPGWIVENTVGMYVNDGILCVEATRAGVPCLTFEIGEGGRLEQDFVTTGAHCVVNVMGWLKMVDAPHVAPKRGYVMTNFLGIRATHGGLLYNDVDLGAEVRRGDVLCRIVNVYGDEVERVVAPQDGIFVRATTLSTVSTGERVATLGVTHAAN
jgi:predicted deacylase